MRLGSSSHAWARYRLAREGRRRLSHLHPQSKSTPVSFESDWKCLPTSNRGQVCRVVKPAWANEIRALSASRSSGRLGPSNDPTEAAIRKNLLMEPMWPIGICQSKSPPSAES